MNTYEVAFMEGKIRRRENKVDSLQIVGALGRILRPVCILVPL